MKRKYYYISLVACMLLFFFYAVLYRDNAINRVPVRLNLFQGYIKPSTKGYSDIVVNIACFIPIGYLIGRLSKKWIVLKSLHGGLFFSLFIECSQLIWKRGTFDVDDLFNNTLGALIGSLLAFLLMIEKKDCSAVL